LPTISTCPMTSFASGRTTRITIDRTEPSIVKPHTNGSWQIPLPVCHPRLEMLQGAECASVLTTSMSIRGLSLQLAVLLIKLHPGCHRGADITNQQPRVYLLEPGMGALPLILLYTVVVDAVCKGKVDSSTEFH
jgi:hypothetical protein